MVPTIWTHTQTHVCVHTSTPTQATTSVHCTPFVSPKYWLVMLRVTCWCSCVFCRGTLSSLWVVLEFGFGAPVFAMAQLLLSWLTLSFSSFLCWVPRGGVARSARFKSLFSSTVFINLILFTWAPKYTGFPFSYFPMLDLLVHVLPFFSSPYLSPLFSVIASSLPLLLPFYLSTFSFVSTSK